MKSAIAAAIKHQDFSIESPRIVNAKYLAEELLKKAVENAEKFDVFAEKLLKLLQSTSVKDGRMKHSTRRNNMWSAFHKLRISKLSSLWCSLMKDIGLHNDDTGKNKKRTITVLL